MLVRGTLALATSLALGYYTQRIRIAHGPTTARLYTLLQLTQFHIPYYASRTLPNTFALVLTTLANAAFLPGGHPSVGIALLAVTAVVFRAEVALLLAFYATHLLLTRRIRPAALLVAGAVGGIAGLAATLAVDSFFWQSSPPIFSTPGLGRWQWLWPEASAFYFNAVQGHASEWGTQPAHYYFSSCLPKLLLNPITLLTLPTALAGARRAAGALLLPNLWFVGIYSLLVAHKEWRFVVYAVPPLTHLSALGGTWLWTRRHKAVVFQLAALGLAASLPVSMVAAGGILALSSTNYPGGVALSRLPRHLPAGAAAAAGNRTRVWMDVETCMTGASRFLQDSVFGDDRGAAAVVKVEWDKTEDAAVLRTSDFWRGVDFAITADPELVRARGRGAFEVVDVVRAFGGAKVLKPDWHAGEPEAAGAAAVKTVERQRWQQDGFGIGLGRGWQLRIDMKEALWILRRRPMVE